MPVHPRRTLRLVPALALPLVLVACGGGTASPSAPVPASPPAAASPTAPAPSLEPSVAPSGSAGAPGSPSAAADVTVTAVDFAFEGVPDEVPAGTSLGLVNGGQEVHEMVIVRRLPGTTQSIEELLAMPPEEAQALVEDVGYAFAEPGATGDQAVTVDTAGSYVMLCFIPAGTTSLPSMDPEASAPPSLGTGAPHFALGMVTEFTVAE